MTPIEKLLYFFVQLFRPASTDWRSALPHRAGGLWPDNDMICYDVISEIR